MAYNLGGCRSIQLSYERNPHFVVILKGHVKLRSAQCFGCSTLPSVAAPNQQGQRAQRAHQHGVGLPGAQRQHSTQQCRHIQGRPRYPWQGRLRAVRRKPGQHNINKRKTNRIQRRLPHGPAQPGQQNHAPRRGWALAATPVHHGIHHGVQLYALAQLTPAGRIGRHHGQNKRQQGKPRLIKAKVPAQRKHQQKAQTAVGRHNAAQFKGIEPKKFNDYAKGKGQRPVAGKKARNQGQTDGAVYEADDAG